MIEDLKDGDWVSAILGTSSIVGRVFFIHGQTENVVVDGGFVDYPESMARKGGQYLVPTKHILKRFAEKPECWMEDSPEVRKAYYEKKEAEKKAQYWEEKSNG